MARSETRRLTLAFAMAFSPILLVACGGGGGGRDTGGGGVDTGGMRSDTPVPPGTDAPGMGGMICMDTCRFAGDMECDDGGPMSMTSVCEFGTDCMDCGPRDPASCTPDCMGRMCGSDGCGGTCGSCSAPATCTTDGMCEVCTPDCGTRTCGDDGCGGSCGMCSGGAMCAFGACRMPDCAGRVCGSDGAGGRCGPMDGACPMGQGCRDGACVACDCTGRMCGTTTGCDSCGDCPMMGLCDRLTGMCAATAMPAACNNTCRFSGDNECDDGRPGSHTSLCMPGTDCADCGPM